MSKRIESFSDLVRQPTGTHMCDSGGESGRHWQKPALPAQLILINGGEYNGKLEFSARINLAEFFDRTLKIDVEMTAKLRELEAAADDWFWTSSAADALAEALDWEVQGSADNSYNHENDLSQDFQYAILTPKGESDWLYASECLVLIQSHNGADVRGGYSDTIVCRSDGNYDFLEWTVGWRLLEGTRDGVALSESELETLGQEFETGCSANPSYRFGEEIETVLAVESDSVTVLLKSGETVKAYPECRAEFL